MRICCQFDALTTFLSLLESFDNLRTWKLKTLILVQELKLQTGSPKTVGKLELGHLGILLQGFKDFVHLVIMGSVILLAG